MVDRRATVPPIVKTAYSLGTNITYLFSPQFLQGNGYLKYTFSSKNHPVYSFYFLCTCLVILKFYFYFLKACRLVWMILQKIMRMLFLIMILFWVSGHEYFLKMEIFIKDFIDKEILYICHSEFAEFLFLRINTQNFTTSC